MPCRLLIAFVLAGFVAHPALANIAVGAGQQKIHLAAGELEVLEDASRNLTREEAASPEASARFRKIPISNDLNLGYSSSAWWLRFSVFPAQDVPKEWLLEFA